MSGLRQTDDGEWLWSGTGDLFDNYEEDEDRVSVFVGVCGSEELFKRYWRDEVLAYDFGLCYDEDFSRIKFREEPSGQIDELFSGAAIFDLEELKQVYPHGLDRAYNVLYEVGHVDYKGVVAEVRNEEFGYFRFLGSFTETE